MSCEYCHRVPGQPILCATCQRELLTRIQTQSVRVGPPPERQYPCPPVVQRRPLDPYRKPF